MVERLAQRAAWWRLAAVLLLLLPLVLSGAARAQVDGATPQATTERNIGDWQQFVADGNGAWRPLGIYRVERSEGVYRMAPLSQSQEPDVTASKGLSDVRFEDAAWRFNSDWGNGDVGEFRLERFGPGIYAGWSYLRGQQRNYNLWVLIH
jgi:hypothetical protein